MKFGHIVLLAAALMLVTSCTATTPGTGTAVSEKHIVQIDTSSWIPESFRTSPDSKQVAYAAKVGDEWFVVVNGKKGKQFSGIGSGTPIFSPDSQRVAYIAGVDYKQLVVVDGKKGNQYDAIALGTLVFSPDSQRVA